MKFTLFKQKIASKLNSSEKEFLPAALEVIEMPPSLWGRAIVWTTMAIIVVALAWSIIGTVDEVAVAPGKLIPVGYVKTIQPEDKGVIKTIYVSDGQLVHAGELLLELDPTATDANLARLRKQMAYYTLDIDRLSAERDNTPFNPQLSADVETKDIDLQRKLYQSRNDEYSAKLNAARQKVLQNESALQVARTTLVRYQAQYELAKDKENRLTQLIEQNAIELFALLDQKAKRIELEQNCSATIADIERNKSALAESTEELQQTISAHDRDIATTLVDDRKQIQAIAEELKKAEEQSRLAQIRSPIDGRVHSLSVHTIGGVVTPAQPLMIIVPDGVIIEVESWVANKDIGFVHPGQHAEIKVETFNFQKYGTVPAELVELSPDVVDDPDKGPVYRATLHLLQDTVTVGGQQVYLSPGMTVSAEIKTREKHIIEFFLDPFKKYKSEGLRER